ncbi:MAG: hypothetical protein AAF468_12405 [Pseudomonadota bacterium]
MASPLDDPSSDLFSICIDRQLNLKTFQGKPVVPGEYLKGRALTRQEIDHVLQQFAEARMRDGGVPDIHPEVLQQALPWIIRGYC